MGRFCHQIGLPALAAERSTSYSCRPSNSFSRDFFCGVITGPLGLRWNDMRKECLGTPGNESQPSDCAAVTLSSMPSPTGAEHSRQSWAQLSGHQQSQTQQAAGPRSNLRAWTGAKGDRAKRKQQQGSEVLLGDRAKSKPEDKCPSNKT